MIPLLPTPKAVTRVGFSSLFVGFSRQYLKNTAARITKHDTQIVLETHSFWGQKVKGQGHNVCVSLQTECNIAAAAVYVSYAGFSVL